MPILAFLSSLFGPVASVVQNLHTSDAEKLQLQNELTKITNEFYSKSMEYESKILEAQSSIIKAEAQGENFLQTSWRPVTMYVFLALTVCDSFGLLHTPLAPQAWTLLQLGLGGYVVGRSIEKVVPAMVEASKK